MFRMPAFENLVHILFFSDEIFLMLLYYFVIHHIVLIKLFVQDES